MADKKLLKLFSLKISHDFYKSGVCSDFNVIPSSSCKKLLSRYKLLLRKLSDGVEIYYEANGSNNPTIKINSEEKFKFYLELKNKLFYNISDLPDENINANIFFLTNKQASDPDSLILHKSVTALDEENFISLVTESFSVEKTSSSSAAVFELKNIDEEIVKQNNPIVELEEKENTSDPDSYKIIYSINLENKSTGKYDLTFNGGSPSEFYSDNTAFQKKYFGVVEIYKSNNTERDYKIKIAKKNSYWKYIIVPKYQTDITITDLEINSTESFGTVSAATLEDGTNVGIFNSQSMIAFTEAGLSSVKLQLKGHGNQTSTLIENLPNANPENIKIEKNTNKVYSEVFVYI